MHESTERKRRLRQKRRDANIQAYEVWLLKALVDEVKRPNESINALVSRALNLLKHYALAEANVETNPETSPSFRGYTIISNESTPPTTHVRYEKREINKEIQDTLHTVTSHETSPIPPMIGVSYEEHKAAVIQRLRAMQAEGLSTQTIANQLNAEGVPTLSGRGSWKKGTVGNLLHEAS